jgi:PAS domain S-box-containing protein
VIPAEVLIQTALLGEAIDQGPALVFIADDDMRYIAVNEFACESLGYPREELLGMSVADVVRTPDAPIQYEEMQETGFHRGKALLTRKDGSTATLAYQATETRVANLDLYVSIGFLES